ncbi:L-pipecolate oxidase [Tolypocladium ophioglossoides CBS 100239]|uniref:L-pipecolate oxidase n=1 Tax=Tolypocladium ophioglossoides (strain CBS 100239) TaxID=1163406 RepID=A0A0L0N3J0_TOLOC|nr:L-pipecolate oxidase [Tolypocladium ophioglossoides CBS 100239]
MSEPMSPRPFPASIIIIGAGVFGLSTALAISKRHPSTRITVMDRLTPPVEDGSSVDTTRCIRSDYTDPIYARLALQSQKMIQDDPDLRQHLYQQGVTFVCDGEQSRFTEAWEERFRNAKRNHDCSDIVELPTREKVFQRIHGNKAQPCPLSELGGKSRSNMAYCNLEAAFIDAQEGIRAYYHRCTKIPTITFRCGTAVDRLHVVHDRAKGVVMADGSAITADCVIIAAGAWSNKLVDLGRRTYSLGHEVAWFKVTPEEEARWKDMPITTNESTGLNIFPPYRGEVKVLRRSPGYKNTITVSYPENPTKVVEISYPRTIVDSPTDMIPPNAELAIRRDLREIMPPLAERPCERTKICWISTTPTADFLIAPHPHISDIHLATGDSAHAWKFLPVLGDFVVDSLQGILSKELAGKWAFDRFSGGKDENAPRMDGAPEELRDVVRNHL